LNEQPDEVQDTLEPDYEGFKKMQPVIDQMKNAFFGGRSEDPLSRVAAPKTNKRKKERSRD
jgi:hypothetical protein